MSFFRPDATSLQSNAAAALVKGDVPRALDLYRAAARAEPRQPMHTLRSADCLVRLGRVNEALAVYRGAAERWADDGQLARAVSVYRIILRLTPRDTAASRRLAELKRMRQDRVDHPRIPGRVQAVPPEISEMFPVIELDTTPVAAPAASAVANAELTRALEATVRDLLAELLRVQSELDALRGPKDEAAAIVTV